ncbi:Adaptor for signal transduction [Orbilia blumenaviensis]|uniref:Adaptor for signal transduction n=1 Tax=Orbilia blumenaviensis TaxID=1796055 RepID=A0AAV9UZ00_9PEZI
MTSPQYATMPASPNKIPSAQATPTFAQMQQQQHIPELPNKNIMNWSTEDVVTFMNELGLPQYPDAWIDNEVTGDALIHLNHDELLEMGIESIGHRMQILKAVYKVKIAHEVPIEPEHYVPITANPADANPDTTFVTISEFQQLISAVKLRDDKVFTLEQELRRVNEAFNRLREEMLPILKTIKNETKPLPKPSSNSTATSTTPTYKDFDYAAYDRDSTYRSRGQDHTSESVDIRREPTPQPVLSQPPTRKYSVKKVDKNHLKGAISPTTDRSTIREQFATVKETGTLDSIASTLIQTPSSAIQSPPTGTAKDRSESTVSLPANTLPPPISPHNPAGGLQRSFSTRPSGRYTTRSSRDEILEHPRARSRDRDTRRQDHPPMASPPAADDEGSNPPTVEIFKSFRVSMDDPCYKVLPAALKRYNIQADWQHYALYIVYGDQERCLGYEEKPLILFKQLDKEGKKPMFMLRRHINPESGQPSGVVTANPPGGVL